MLSNTNVGSFEFNEADDGSHATLSFSRRYDGGHGQCVELFCESPDMTPEEAWS